MKQQQETVIDRIIENKISNPEENEKILDSNKKVGTQVKTDYLNCTKSFAEYQKKCNSNKTEYSSDDIGAMTSAMAKMAEAFISTKTDKTNSLEKLSVPVWDGRRKSYLIWKQEFKYWMQKCKQDEEEQLQRFRKALPKHSFWADQVKYCKSVKKAFEILDIEFANKRKLMDELLNEITYHKQVKGDSVSFSRYATKIMSFTNDMEENGCPVLDSNEAPFIMSQLLSKLEPKDNADFGRDMIREQKEENITNLIDWLYREANLRSRGKRFTGNDYNQPGGTKTPKVNAVDSSQGEQAENTSKNSFEDPKNHKIKQIEEELCPLKCKTNHRLPDCPVFQNLSVDERWAVVKKNNLCRKCLMTHHTNTCKKPNGTTCKQCPKNHHYLLHNNSRNSDGIVNVNQQFDQSIPKINPEPSSESPVETQSNNVQKCNTVKGICPVQKLRVRNKNGEFVEILAMIDSGSNVSLMSKNTAKQLGLKGPEVNMTMNLAGGKQISETSQQIEISLAPINEDQIVKTAQILTVQKPCSAAKPISRTAAENYSHVKSVINKLHLDGGSIDLLIGTDFPAAFIDVHIKQGEQGEPIAKRNCFGWYVLGVVGNEDSDKFSGIVSVDVGTASAEEDIKKLLIQDQLGVKPTSMCTCTDDMLKENKFIKSLADSTKIINGRVEVKMPWKESGPPRQSNYNVAYQRMLSSEKSFRNKKCFDEIQIEVQKLKEQEFVIEVPPDQVNHNKPEWYLPMQAVFTPERSTKIRLVFDASAKGPDNKSLNDYLEKGPNYINNIQDVLMAWRWDQVGYCGDLRKMFNQIVIHPEDQIFHRFLFREHEDDDPKIFQWQRLNFGDKPAPDIATGSIKILAKSYQEQLPEASQQLQDNVYVDDIGGSEPTSEKAKTIINDIDTILSTGKFQVKSWNSNNKEVDTSDEKCTAFLGHKWNKEIDVFTLKKEFDIKPERTLTKRRCLSLVSQLWDPLGLVLPVMIKFRVDLQDLWASGFSWDEDLPGAIQSKWIENFQILNKVPNLQFNRKIKPDNAVDEPEVHGFCDAGELAYGAVIFLRWKCEDGSYRLIPIMVKGFVAPLRKKSIPRLELLGCLVLVRIYQACVQALKFANAEEWDYILWTDSQTVLSWIKTPARKFKPFVSARVAEIQESVDVGNFRYVKSNDNPADALSRGIHINELESWMAGPQFLLCSKVIDDSTDLSENSTSEQGNVEYELEVKSELKEIQEDVTSKNCNTMKATDNALFEQLLQRCSSFSKIRRTLSYVLRFIRILRCRVRETNPISVNELKASENLLFRWCQQVMDIKKFPILKLKPKIDEDGLLRAHGRLENIRSLPQEMCKPIILPRNHPLVILLLRHLHEKKFHCGYKSLVHETRKKFWIIGVRSAAKQLNNKCITCKKLRSKPMEQLEGQLPSLRVATGLPAFTNTAMDMFGPVHIKMNRKTRVEAQVIIFTCMTTRAIHLELVTDKSTDTFLMAFRRFACTRGHPNVCWSDCGTNFIGAQAYLKEIMSSWDTFKIQKVLAEEFSCDFRWEFNIPKASHQNGVVESLIKSVRQAMNATCKDQAYTEEQWHTILKEITYLVNSRPLYPSSEDIFNDPPISPNDLIIGQHIPPPVPEEENKVNPRNLLRICQKKIHEFWKAWIKYFAPNLLPRNKWFHTRENLKIGDLVLELDSTSRRQWKMAIVVNTYPGKDNLVRKVQIRTAKGCFDRPIHKLCLIATKEQLEN